MDIYLFLSLDASQRLPQEGFLSLNQVYISFLPILTGIVSQDDISQSSQIEIYIILKIL